MPSTTRNAASRSLRRALALALVFAPAAAAQDSPRSEPPIFRIQTNEFWLNLHNFLYVLGRHHSGQRDATRDAVVQAPADEQRGLAGLTQAERDRWQRAVQQYARTTSRRDPVFDPRLPDLLAALADQDDASSLARASIEPSVARVLEDAAHIYRKAWWNEHSASNEGLKASLTPLIDRHGRAILGFITDRYGTEWPEGGYPIHVSAFTNWAGAYSTRGNFLAMSSRYDAVTGNYGLETLFHESMHQWDDTVDARLSRHAIDLGVRVNGDLSHVMIFFTAGEAVRRAVPGHIPYGEANGVYERRWGALRDAVVEIWKPYLDGNGTRDAALRALVQRTGTPGSR
jgi:hypothetical protein